MLLYPSHPHSYPSFLSIGTVYDNDTQSSYAAAGNKVVVADSPVGKLGLSVVEFRFVTLLSLSQISHACVTCVYVVASAMIFDFPNCIKPLHMLVHKYVLCQSINLFA
jgi:hypothetical protein